MKKFLLTIILILGIANSALSQKIAEQDLVGFPDSCKISLITCYPGPLVYELYGHTAIRVKSDYGDLAYNFGMFSFNKPNFMYTFVKGETDYMLGYTPFDGDRYYNFINEYRYRGSRIVEQELNISNEKAVQLWKRLHILSLPENREYRYNYVLDNCATRPRDMIESLVGGLKYPVPADTTLSFRDIMAAHSPNYPWYQFGIDLALGSGIDYTVTTRQQQFAPVLLMEAMAKATYTDENGKETPIVSKTNIINEGTGNAILPPTPWYLSPLFIALILMIAIGYASYRDIKRGKVSKWIDCIWFTATGLLGSLITFLVFASEHEATSPNYLIFWLNPLCFIASLLIWIKSLRKWVVYYHFINFAVVLILFAFWWAIPQCANTAIFPMVAITLMRSATNIITLRNAKKKTDK